MYDPTVSAAVGSPGGPPGSGVARGCSGGSYGAGRSLAGGRSSGSFISLAWPLGGLLSHTVGILGAAMGGDVTVRPVRPEEYEVLASVTLDAYRALLGPDIDGEYADELGDVAARAAQTETLVAVDGTGRLMGGVAYVPGPGPLDWFDGPDEAGFRMLAVAPTAQGQGVGAALVAACIDRAVAAGKARLFLHTTAPMTVAQRLYERAGFHRDPERDRVLQGELVLLGYVLELGSGR